MKRTPEQLEELYAKFDDDMVTKSRLRRFILAIDQLGNVLFWNGSQDETISSHIHRRKEKGEATWFDNMLCFLLSKLENSHCYRARGE